MLSAKLTYTLDRVTTYATSTHHESAATLNGKEGMML